MLSSRASLPPVDLSELPRHSCQDHLALQHDDWIRQPQCRSRSLSELSEEGKSFSHARTVPQSGHMPHTSNGTRGLRLASPDTDCDLTRLFGFLLGSTLAGASVYYYILEEYKVSNELLTEDIYVGCNLSLAWNSTSGDRECLSYENATDNLAGPTSCGAAHPLLCHRAREQNATATEKVKSSILDQ